MVGVDYRCRYRRCRMQRQYTHNLTTEKHHSKKTKKPNRITHTFQRLLNRNGSDVASHSSTTTTKMTTAIVKDDYKDKHDDDDEKLSLDIVVVVVIVVVSHHGVASSLLSSSFLFCFSPATANVALQMSAGNHASSAQVPALLLDQNK